VTNGKFIYLFFDLFPFRFSEAVVRVTEEQPTLEELWSVIPKGSHRGGGQISRKVG